MVDKKVAGTEPQAGAPNPTIEELAEKLGVKTWALEGAKRAYGWGAGKRLPESDFRAQIEAWLKGPMHR